MRVIRDPRLNIARRVSKPTPKSSAAFHKSKIGAKKLIRVPEINSCKMENVPKLIAILHRICQNCGFGVI